MYNEQEINRQLDAWRAETFPKIRAECAATGLVFRSQGLCPNNKYFSGPEAPYVFLTCASAVPLTQDELIQELKDLETWYYTRLPYDNQPEGIVSYRFPFWTVVPNHGLLASTTFTTTTGYMRNINSPVLWDAPTGNCKGAS